MSNHDDSTDFSEVTAELQRAENAKNRSNNQVKYSKVSWGKVPYGDTKLMILKGRPLFVQVDVHHNYEDSQGNKRAYLCARAKYGTCPGCDKANAAKEAGQVKESIALKAQRSYLYNGVDASGESKVYGLKQSQHTEVLQEINVLRNDEGIDATEPENNVQIKITRMKVTPYARARAVKNKEKLSAEKTKQLLDARRDLNAIYMDLTVDMWNDILAGKDIIPIAGGTPEPADDSIEETPAPTTAKAAVTKPVTKPAVTSKPAPAKPAAKLAPTVSTTEDGEEFNTDTGEIIESSAPGEDADLKRIQALLES